MWFNRNEVRVGKAWQQALAIVQKARLLLDKFHMTNFKLTQIELRDEVHWVPPDAPYWLTWMEQLLLIFKLLVLEC